MKQINSALAVSCFFMLLSITGASASHQEVILVPTSHYLSPGDEFTINVQNWLAIPQGMSFDHSNYMFSIDPHVEATGDRCFSSPGFISCDETTNWLPTIRAKIKPDTKIGTILTISTNQTAYMDCYSPECAYSSPIIHASGSTKITVVPKNYVVPAPEFPAPVIPLISLIGLVAAVIFVKKRE